MKYIVEHQIINRMDTPANSDTHRHIKDMTIEKIYEFESGIVPEINEILVIGDKKYTIVEKIRILPTGIEEEIIILRVKEYSEIKLYQYGSRCWEERVPLFID